MTTFPTSEEAIPRQPVEQRGPRGFVCPNYSVTDPKTGRPLQRTDTLAGGEIGAWVAGLYDQATEGQADLPQRCSTCAFRKGAEGNQSIQAVGDAMESIATGETFYCHTDIRVLSDDVGHICYGFQAVNNSAVGSWIREMRAAGKF